MIELESSEFSSRVEELMRQHHVPGVSIAIIEEGKIASAGYGYASLEAQKPCNADTLFDIASSSKSLTAAAVGLLVDDNEKYPEVQYNAIMSSLLPDDFVMPNVGYTEGVTLEDILSHRSGMASHDSSYLGPQAAQPDDARSVTRNLRNLPVAAPIRSKYLYCNMMYTVASHLVAVKSQQRFSEFLQQHIFHPLGMESTSLQPSSARAAGHGDRMATGHSWDKNSSAYREFPSPDCPEGQGAGSIVASANDFVKFVKALMNHEEPINERVYHGLVRMRSFPNPSARRLKPHTSPVVYAAGLEVYYYRGYMVVGHDGSIAGFSSRFLFLPGIKFGAVILANSSSALPLITILMREMIDKVLKIPDSEPANRGNKTKPAPGPVGTDMAVRSKKPPKEIGNKEENEKKQAPKPRKKKQPTAESDNRLRQETPLSAYVGTYWHPGYRNLTVQIREERLFIDATDRSMGFNIVFEHVEAQTRYTAHLIDVYDEEDEPLAAEFVFNGDKAVKMGLHIEPVLKDMIWFERVEGKSP